MAKDKELVTLGSGDIYLNSLIVGYTKGDTVLTVTSTREGFMPNGEKSYMKYFTTEQIAQIKFNIAQLDVANLRYALGITTAALSSSSFPAYDPSSYSATAGDSFDIQKFGGEDLSLEVPLRFEHTIPGTTKKIIVVFYVAVCISDFNVEFKEKEIVIPEMTWEALVDTSRSSGDKLGFIARTVDQT